MRDIISSDLLAVFLADGIPFWPSGDPADPEPWLSADAIAAMTGAARDTVRKKFKALPHQPNAAKKPFVRWSDYCNQSPAD